MSPEPSAPPALTPPQAPTAPAPVAEPMAARGAERGPIGFLLHIGPFSGFGAGVSLGSRAIGLRASGGWTPAFLVLQTSSGSTADIKFYSTWQVSPDVYVRLFNPRPTTDIGLQAGYRYNSLFGHGVAAGGYAQFGLGRSFDGFVSGGFLVFPDGEDRLRNEEHLPSSTTFSFPGPDVTFTLSVGLAFLP